MTALKRIQVKGFKSIREMDLELRPLNILIGANGSGKSNFLSVFRLLNQIGRKSLQLYVAKSGGADTLLYFGQKITDKINLNLETDLFEYAATLKSISGNQLVFEDERFFSQKNQRETVFQNKSPETSLRHTSIDAEDRTADAIFGYFDDLRIYHFHDTTDSAKIKLTSYIDDNHFIQSDGGNLAAVLYLLRERYRPYYDRIVETVQLIAPFFEDFVLQPMALNPDTIQLDWKEKGTETVSKAYMLSDGTLRFMCLATLLRQPNPPPLILIDEPELGLHPHAIIILVAMLKSAATKTQIIVTSQSVTLANQFYPEDLVVVDRDAQSSTFKHLNPTDIAHWTEDYAMGELWEQNIIGGTP